MTKSGIHTAVQSLTEEQQNTVREIGFGSLFSLRLTRLPKKLAMYLVQRFNVYDMSIKLEHSTINIDEDYVNLVLGIPSGTKKVDDSSKQTEETEEHKAFIKEIKREISQISTPSVSCAKKTNG